MDWCEIESWFRCRGVLVEFGELVSFFRRWVSEMGVGGSIAGCEVVFRGLDDDPNIN